MKFKITLSQTPMMPPISGDTMLPIIDIDKTYSVTYNLTKNCNTTNKFIDVCSDALHTNPTYHCGYNIYKEVDIDTYIFLQNRMNSIIEIINTTDGVPSINKSLILNVGSRLTENSKLNKLHFYFEEKTKDGNNYGQYINGLLEEINQIVHILEGGNPESQNRGTFSFQAAIRLAPDNSHNMPKTLPLTDEDYSNFTIDHEWGDLLLDYYRVGKDLYNAVMSNDVKLVTNREVCQQNTVHPAIFMECQPKPVIPLLDFYDTWCDKNNVRDYYDIDLPMFSLGRVVLGKIDTTGTTQEEVIKELSKCSRITNIEMVNE